MTQLPFHPLAELFPLFADAELDELAADIKAHGQRDPIIMTQGMDAILDGRNRYRACLKIGVQPRFEPYEGEEAGMLDFVVSRNLRRRHLTESQRAMIAADLASMKRGDNQHASKEATSQAKAAQLMNASRPSVQRAAKVKANGDPGLREAVLAGELSVSGAAVIAGLPKEEQTSIVAGGPDTMRTAARAAIAGHRAGYSGDFEWYTPPEYLDLARRVLGAIDLDPASCARAQENVGAATFYNQADDGLSKEWEGRVWLNPPYAHPAIANFVDKLIGEYLAGRAREAILLTNSSSDTGWFHAAAGAASGICLTKGRISFLSPDRQIAPPKQGQAFFYFGPNAARFAEVFGGIGLVYGRPMPAEVEAPNVFRLHGSALPSAEQPVEIVKAVPAKKVAVAKKGKAKRSAKKAKAKPAKKAKPTNRPPNYHRDYMRKRRAKEKVEAAAKAAAAPVEERAAA